MASSSIETKPDIILNSPVGAKPAVYKWPLTYVLKGQKIDGAEEIVETIKWVAREYSEFKPAIENLLPEQPDLRSYDCIKSLCDKYNRIPEMVLKMNKGTSVAPKTSSRASQGLLKHIIQQVYNYAVTDPTELNKYSPFSSQTYGETSFEFMAQLIEKNQFRPKEHDTFIDLGSGVGHLVLQMAASVECKKCYGIEISSVPAGYAKVMEERFKFWMSWHGKTYSDFELYHADFFEKKYADLIKNATYIFVNNYAFRPEVDHKLKQRFLDLKDGVQILSSKPFCSPKARVSERHLTDIGSIMRVIEINPELKKDSVSWTNKPLPYYLHVLDGSPVEKYYERQKRRQGRSTERGKPVKRRKTAKGSDSMSDDSDDNIVYGPTTRKAWSEWCNSTNANNRASTDVAKTGSSRNNSTDTENYESAIENEETSATVKTTTPAAATTTTPTPTPPTKAKETDAPKQREKRGQDNQNSLIERPTTSSGQGSGAGQGKNSAANSQAAKSCLDKKRDYAIKKGGSNLLQKAPPSALYSISKPADSANGSSTSKIPNIVIKVKPTVESKVTEGEKQPRISPHSTRASAEAQKQDIKVNDENGTKKLRQRKKSTATPTQANGQGVPSTTTSTTTALATNLKKSEAKTAASSSILNLTSNGTRSKKAAQVSATARTSGRATAARKKSTASDKTSSLDLLHAKTIESVAGIAGYFPKPGPGCEDHSLGSIVDTPSLPKVVIKDLSMFVNDFLRQKTIEKFTECTRQELEKFASKIQHPQAREILTKEIEKERMRNRLLQERENELLKEIRLLGDRVPSLMASHCDVLGIKNSPKYIVKQLGALLKQHQDLFNYSLQLETTLQSNQRTMNPPAAHSNSNQGLSSPYHRNMASSSATLDLSLKQAA